MAVIKAYHLQLGYTVYTIHPVDYCTVYIIDFIHSQKGIKQPFLILKVEKRSNREKNMLMSEESLNKALRDNDISRRFYEDKTEILQRMWGKYSSQSLLLRYQN